MATDNGVATLQRLFSYTSWRGTHGNLADEKLIHVPIRPSHETLLATGSVSIFSATIMNEDLPTCESRLRFDCNSFQVESMKSSLHCQTWVYTSSGRLPIRTTMSRCFGSFLMTSKNGHTRSPGSRKAGQVRRHLPRDKALFTEV
jgi:hypothetical protein